MNLEPRGCIKNTILDLEQLLLLSIAQIEAKKAAAFPFGKFTVTEPLRSMIMSESEASAHAQGYQALDTPGRYGRYLKRHALRKLEEIQKGGTA
jgi:hypothetical protein